MKRKGKTMEEVNEVVAEVIEDNFEKLSLSQCRDVAFMLKMEADAMIKTNGVGYHIEQARRNYLIAAAITTLVDAVETQP